MHITRLSLTNYRNYGRLELALPLGSTLLHGDNAQGKTNLLESIYYLATTRSPHAEYDRQLISWDGDNADEPVVVGRLIADVVTSQGPLQIELRLIRELNRGQATFRRQALLNRRKVRLMDLLGQLRVVLFLPHDVQIITGSPATRRRYLDITLCQTDPLYCRTLSSYNKVLEQRNALLRQIVEQGRGRDVLPVYNEKLANLGALIFAKRAVFIDAISRGSQEIHRRRLTGGNEKLRLYYLPRMQVRASGRGNLTDIEPAIKQAQWMRQRSDTDLIAQRILTILADSEQAELASGSTRIGPHRDDWNFWLDDRNLGSYGSRGQQRSAVLAMKLAEIRWMADVSGDEPVLLLDEVVAELDAHRRALLLETIQDSQQAIITATDPSMLTDDFLDQATTLLVKDGQIAPDHRSAVL